MFSTKNEPLFVQKRRFDPVFYCSLNRSLAWKTRLMVA